ncbi:MAG: tellurite resistance TerB family protein [Chromatiales bacterium]
MDQLLRSGQSMLGSGGPAAGGGADDAGGLGGFGKGALAGGALGLLLGSRRVRKLGGTVALYGGVAALGALAYRAYGDWQREQGAGTTEGLRTVDRLQGAEAEDHSRGILKAMLAAARADGHIDEREQVLIDQEVSRLAGSAGLTDWMSAELRRPLDPAEVARAATTRELAAEMYLASFLMVDQESFMERAYLDGLAEAMGLDPDLKARLEAQARAA